uniref:Uncharacterized protein n=1 Tax=Rhizophagus irregularis (strain DAOM 181602 / DAOM 197198 / MUCL 43194) TaxID=747089 RepID=U9URW2_RHIID
MPIIHVRISYNSVTLKDWEGLPVEKETEIKDFLMIYQFHIYHLISGEQILNGLFKKALCFNYGAECEEENNCGEYVSYCEDCST